MKKKALILSASPRKGGNIIGATGLVGSELLKQLLDNGSYSSVLAFVRRDIHLSHPKLKQHIVDFDKPDINH